MLYTDTDALTRNHVAPLVPRLPLDIAEQASRLYYYRGCIGHGCSDGTVPRPSLELGLSRLRPHFALLGLHLTWPRGVSQLMLEPLGAAETAGRRDCQWAGCHW